MRRVAVTCVVVLALGSMAHAGGAELATLGARVVKVDANKRLTIDRGSRGGIVVGDAGDIFQWDDYVTDGDMPGLHFDAPIAHAKVVSVTRDQAVLALDTVVNVPRVQAYFRYRHAFPADRMQSPLLRVLGHGVTLVPDTGKPPYVTFEALLADPTLDDKTLDAMIVDVKRLANYEITRAQLRAILAFVDIEYEGRLNSPEELKGALLAFINRGQPDVSGKRTGLLATPDIEAARAAIKTGKLDDARAKWNALLVRFPTYDEAKNAIAGIDRVQLMQRASASDPDDLGAAYRLMDELDTLGAYELALAQYPRLKKGGFDADKLDLLYANVLVRAEHYREAEPLLTRLAKATPALATWARYCAVRAKLAKAPGDATALLDYAGILEEWENWKLAILTYRFAQRAERVTPKQRVTARNGKDRVIGRSNIASTVQIADRAIRRHDLKEARDLINIGLTLVKLMAEPGNTLDLLTQLGDVAYDVYEKNFAAELYNQHVSLVPTHQKAYTGLATVLFRLERVDEAEAAAKKALTLKGDTDDTAHTVLALVALARNDLAAVEKEASAITDKHGQGAWRENMLARVEAARDDWQEAVARARKAQVFTDNGETRNTLAASERGLQAYEALQANSGAARERLRLVRALADLGLIARVNAEVAKLPATGNWREDGLWAVVAAGTGVLVKDRLAAARAIKPTAPYRKDVVAGYETRAAFFASPNDDAKRVAAARSHVADQNWDLALATAAAVAGSETVISDANVGAEATAQEMEANQALRRGDIDAALKLAQAAQTTYDRLGTIGRIDTRNTRAVGLRVQGKYAEATKVADESVAIARPTGNPYAIAQVEVTAAEVRAASGTNDVLRTAIASSLKLADDTDAEQELYSQYRKSSSLAADDGQWALALEHARKSWSYARRLGRSDLARAAQLQMINANLGAGRYGDSEQLAKQLLADSRKALDSDREQAALLVLGEVELARGHGKLARARFEECYDTASRRGDTGIRAQAKQMIGQAWLSADHDPKQALTAFEQADALLVSLGDAGALLRAGALRAVGGARLELGDTAGARKAAEAGIALANQLQRRVPLAMFEWLLARIALRDNNGNDAYIHAKAMLDLAQKTDDHELLADAWYGLGRAYAMTKRDTEALDAYDKFAQQMTALFAVVGSDTDREGFMNAGVTRRMYADAVEHFLKMGKTARAMEVLDQARDAQLRQTLDPTHTKTSDPKVRANLDAIEQKRARVAGLEKQLEVARGTTGAQTSEAKVKALSGQIAATREDLAKLAIQLKVTHRHLYQALALTPDALADRRAQLPADSVVVEYFVTEDVLYAFVISAALTQPAVVKVNVKSAELRSAVTEFRDALVAENEPIKERDKVEALGRKLNGWLLEPIRPYVKTASTVILLPFGILNHVPFDALVVSPVGQPVRYAIEDLRLSIQTKTTLEFLLKPLPKPRTGGLFAISNPDGSLPGTKREVDQIKTALLGGNVLERKNATIKRFKSSVQGARYIHLATHGVVESNPLKTFLKLSDGPLTIEDIAGLEGIDQNAELVVLSACETALEKDEVASDEQITLAVAFAMAGAPALVASLWEVSDDSTVELMSTFYRALAAGKGDRLDALRNAKLNLLRLQRGKVAPFAPPWHWAGFQLLGDFRTP